VACEVKLGKKNDPAMHLLKSTCQLTSRNEVGKTMSNVESSEHHERSRSPPWKIENDLLYVYKKYRQHRTGAGNGGMDIGKGKKTNVVD